MKFIYTEEQINMIVSCLNSLAITGMDNAKTRLGSTNARPPKEWKKRSKGNRK